VTVNPRRPLRPVPLLSAAAPEFDMGPFLLTQSNEIHKVPENPDAIQSNPWMDPLHVRLCAAPIAAAHSSRFCAALNVPVNIHVNQFLLTSPTGTHSLLVCPILFLTDVLLLRTKIINFIYNRPERRHVTQHRWSGNSFRDRAEHISDVERWTFFRSQFSIPLKKLHYRATNVFFKFN